MSTAVMETTSAAHEKIPDGQPPNEAVTQCLPERPPLLRRLRLLHGCVRIPDLWKLPERNDDARRQDEHRNEKSEVHLPV